MKFKFPAVVEGETKGGQQGQQVFQKQQLSKSKRDEIQHEEDRLNSCHGGVWALPTPDSLD